jgi:superfamily II DNA or RNA helicase
MRQELRDWQKNALAVYAQALKDSRTSILWEATPGAGKTVAAVRLVLDQLRRRAASRVVVVVPTMHLKIQWARSAQRFGLHLDCRGLDPDVSLARDYHGVVLTYQQIGNRPEVFSRICANSVVVLDEVHHSGDGLTWGDSLRIALKNSPFILCLSGTAFRSDNNAIPFVRYSPEGISEPDYIYPYARAVEDGVCRPTVFFTYGGEVSWSEAGLATSAAFSDALDRVGRTRRLRAALDPDSGWIQPLLSDAHHLLQGVRQQHPTAAGLITASSQKHARKLAKVLHDLTGVKPVVVLSDDADASTRLKDFSQGSEPWLVSCNMVSEGVDIPRLRVGVYATTIRTKMYFRQFLGRIVRRTDTPLGAQPAFFYLPADPWLQRLAEEVEQEQRHSLRAKAEDPFMDFGLGEGDVERPERPESTWQVFHGRNSGLASVILGGGQLSLWQTDEPSRSVIDSLELPTPVLGSEAKSKAELKESIAREIRQLVSKYHKGSGQAHAQIHSLLNKQQAVKSQNECTEDQLKQRVQLLSELIERRR